MNIYVCIKQVHDPKLPIKLTADNASVASEESELVINPYDEFALETALSLKETLGKGTVTAVTMGPDRAQKALRSALAMGADEAVLLSDPAFVGSDCLGTARVLAAFFKTVQPDVIWMGKQAMDDDMAGVGQAVGELLGLPCVTEIKKWETAADGKSATVHREIEGGTEELSCSLPAVFTASKSEKEPRYPSLKGIMAAKKKPLKTLTAKDIGVDAATVGAGAARVKVRSLAFPESKRPGLRMLEGDVAAQVQAAVKIIREELKLI